MKRTTYFLLAILLLSSISCSTKFEINKEYIEKHLGFLTSDSLRGRQTFSPEIQIAEEYIAKELKAAGLSPFQENTGFLQSFELIEIAVDKKEVILNGIVLDKADVAIQADNESLNWQNTDDVIVTYIGETDDIGQEFGRIMRNDDDLLVIIHPGHRESFRRYSRWLNRPNRVNELGGSRSLVMVISDIVQLDDYSVTATCSTNYQSLNNVVGWIQGERTEEYVLFSAHHDHIGVRNRKDNPDSIYNGANDDASGTVAVMALANHFASQPKPERSIIFTTFTAEEMGGYGSRYFSEQLDPDQIVAMFNIEMIGKPAVSGPNTAWITGWDKSTFGELMQQSAEGSAYEFYADPYPDQNLFYRSDNATLARLGVPAHSISTTPIDVDKDYHQSSDEIETLDLDHLTNTVKAIAKGAEKIISGELTPSRVDPTEIR